MRDIESKLDQLGYKYSVHAGMGSLGTNYFIYKNQKDHRQEQQELRDLAEKTGGSFDNSAKASYRISITSLERDE